MNAWELLAPGYRLLMVITEPAVLKRRNIRLEAVSWQHAAHAQQRSYSFQAKSFSSTPKSSKRKKGSTGRIPIMQNKSIKIKNFLE